MEKKKIQYSKMMVNELLDLISNDKTVVNELKEKYRFVFDSLRTLLYYGYEETVKFVLPETDPPYIPDNSPDGMSPESLLYVVRKGRLEYFTSKRDINRVRREQIFIQTLEKINHKEAKILLAIKDQNLQKLYPVLTPEYLMDCGLLPFSLTFRKDQTADTNNSKDQD